MNRVQVAKFVFLEAVQKGCHPALDAGSPSVDMGRRYRIGVRYDEFDDFILFSTPFLDSLFPGKCK